MNGIRMKLPNRSYALAALIVCLSLGLTYYGWSLAENNANEVSKAKFETLAKESERALFFRMASYNQGLLGGEGLFKGSDDVSRGEWQKYIQAVDVLKNFPGINGIGTIEDVPSSDLAAFIKAQRLKGAPKFKAHPEGKHPANFIINYIEPIEINALAVGLNIAFEANRYEAAIKSRDSEKAAITKRILLVQDAEKTPGFLLLQPMYDDTRSMLTVEDRRKAFIRWIYAPFIGKNFMHDLTSSQGKTLHLQVYDGAVESKDTLIYDSNKELENEVHASQFLIRKEVEIMQQKWLLVWSSTAAFERLEANHEPFLVLLAGLLFTGLLGVFLVIVIIRNSEEESRAITSYILPLMAFGITLIAASQLRQEIVSREKAFIVNLTKEATRTIKETIEGTVKTRINGLKRMASRWEIDKGTPLEKWQADAKNYLLDHPELKTVEWVDNTYHVRWAEPLKGNESAIGLNILFNEERERALKGAAEKNAVTITPPLDLVQGYKAIISYSPIRVGQTFEGFIVGIFGVDQLIDASFPKIYNNDFVIDLSVGGARFYSSSEHMSARKEKWGMTKEVQLYNKKWDLTVSPSSEFIKRNQSFLPNLVLVLGGVLAFLVASIINFAQRSREKTTLLAEKEELLSTFVEHAPAAVAMLDMNMHYIAASNRWYKDYSIPEKNIIGRSHYDVFPEIKEKHPEWIKLHKRVLAGEVIKVDEEEFIRKNGQKEWLRYELRPWYKTSKVGGIIMFTENITDRKQVDIMKGELVSTINHELRTPLTSIQGSLGLLQAKAADKLDEKGQRLLRLSYENCERLTLLVNDILDIEKIAAGKMKLYKEKTNICELVEEILEQNESYADKYEVVFKGEYEEKVLFSDVDVLRFNQALTNLLSNAAKFSPKKESVLVSVRKKNKKELEISVVDKGPGIPMDFQKKIFGKFAQADSSSTRQKGGTGLGLSITKSIVEMLDGVVSFDTVEGEGSTFYITIPLSK